MTDPLTATPNSLDNELAICDQSADFAQAITDAYQSQQPLCIEAGRSKAFLGRSTQGEVLNVAGHAGLIEHEPSELVITARAGTRIQALQAHLAGCGQMLPFEPPCFGLSATLGGTLACALSGPRRPYAGAARDFVLGVKMINGKGEILSFGGQVMKNVAGYDLSRLMTGSMGTLGVLLEASLKVLPSPAAERTVVFELSADDALRALSTWGGQPIPISGAAHQDGLLRVRVSGTPGGVDSAVNVLGGEVCADLTAADTFWDDLREQRLAFFNDDTPLWRISVPATAAAASVPGACLLDWGGALRWLRSEQSPEQIRQQAAAVGGHASIFRNGDRSGEIYHPLDAGLLHLHRRIKTAFDPAGVLNRGRMYAGL